MEEGGGLSAMENAFPDDTLKIVLSKPGPTVVKPSSVRSSPPYIHPPGTRRRSSTEWGDATYSLALPTVFVNLLFPAARRRRCCSQRTIQRWTCMN